MVMNFLWGGRQRDSCFGSARAADGQARRPAHSSIAGREPVSRRVAAVGGQRGTAAVAFTSLQTGTDACADQEPVGCDRQERGVDRFSDLVGEAPADDRELAAGGLVCQAENGSSEIG